MVSPNSMFAPIAQIKGFEISSRCLLATSACLVGGLCFLPEAIAWSAPIPVTVQIAQVLDALPPPPTIDNGRALPAPSTGAAPTSHIASTQRYLVFVNGNSPLLLAQIQQVEPGAFRREHEGRTVIQTGLFLQQQNAEQQLAQLASQGIGAEIKQVEVETAPPIAQTAYQPPPTSSPSSAAIPIPVVAAPDNSVEFGQPPTFSTINTPPPPPSGFSPANAPFPPAGGLNVDSPYYIVIPGPSDRLPDIRDQVVQLGVTPYSVQLRERPRGPHVAVGPFENRDMAEGWNDYLRGFGLNSRVFFDR